jgi:hypothetical protein
VDLNHRPRPYQLSPGHLRPALIDCYTLRFAVFMRAWRRWPSATGCDQWRRMLSKVCTKLCTNSRGPANRPKHPKTQPGQRRLSSADKFFGNFTLRARVARPKRSVVLPAAALLNPPQTRSEIVNGFRLRSGIRKISRPSSVNASRLSGTDRSMCVWITSGLSTIRPAPDLPQPRLW